MDAPLLTTKLYIPPQRTDLVRRAHLIEQLDEGLCLGRKLTLVSAPAGFGKTTLITDWLYSKGRNISSRSIAWLSLDEADNDPTRFFTYLIAALRQIDGRAGQAAQNLLGAPQLPPIESLMALLVGDIATIPAFVLVLDDYHLIHTSLIHDAVEFLLNHQPPQMHLCLVTRSDPPLSLPSLRARGQLTELRAQDLRFTLEETTDFLNRVMGLALSAQDVAALETRTEGWIAGLQLAALSMQSQENIASFVNAFSGSNRHVIDYLADEVLRRQPDEVQAFLLQTAILDRLNGSLCDAVTGGSDGRELLARLERANLFLVPLDDKREWYRYHQLFADFLCSCPSQHDLSIAHSRAASWYEQHGYIAEAMDHALAGQDFDVAARILEREASPMLAEGHLNQLLGWLPLFPEETKTAHPRLIVHHVWALTLKGELDAAEAMLQTQERILAQGATSLGMAMAARGYVASLRGEVHRGVECSRQALALLPEDDLLVRGIATAMLGLTYVLSGNLAEGSTYLVQGQHLCVAAGIHGMALTATNALALVHQEQGLLARSAAGYRQVIQQTRGQINRASASAHLKLGEVLYKINALDEAWHHLQTGIDMCHQVDLPDGAALGLLWMATIRQAQGAEEAARDLHDQAVPVMKRVQQPMATSPLDALVTRLALMQGKLDGEVLRWADEQEAALERETSDAGFVQRRLELSTLARVWIGQQRWDKAEDLLNRLTQVLRETGHMDHLIEALALEAMVRDARGDQEGAAESLNQTLAHAKAEKYVRVFVDLGDPMRVLLQKTMAQLDEQDYVQELLVAFRDSAAQPPASIDSHPETLVEPLNELELAILRLVAAGLTNPKIASERFVTVNTVKWHLKNIYSKLGVHSRAEAVNRARDLDLL